MTSRSIRWKARGFGALLLVAAGALLGEDACGVSALPTDSLVESPGPPEADTASPSDARSQQTLPFHRILCFGDSITYGVTLEDPGVPPGAQGSLSLAEGYVPKLWRLLESKYGAGFELTNDGAPGEGTNDALARLPLEMQERDPEVVLLLEGINDVNSDTPRFAEAMERLEEMVRLIRGEGRTVVLGTYPPIDPSGFRASNPENVRLLNQRIRRLASERGVILADHELAFTDESGEGPDGIHPNNLGYETMARTWLVALESLAQSFRHT